MNKFKKNNIVIVLSLLFAFGLSMRILSLPAKTLDMNAYIQWYNYILEHGIADSLGSQYFGYNPPFIYLLALATLTHSFLQPIFAIKLIPITFDVINSILMYQIVKTRYEGSLKPVFAALVFWSAPTIFINSSFWGQTDSLYTCFLLLTLLFLLKDNPTFALAAFALSISIKAQGIFLAPLLGLLLFKKRISFLSFIVVPFVYIATFIPALLAGRPINSFFSTYTTQSETFSEASKNVANLYIFVSPQKYESVFLIGVILAIIILSIWVFVYGFRKYTVNSLIILLGALISLILTPYVLPKMHDRYFYPADVFSILAAFFFSKFWLVAVAYQIISLLSYMPFLFNISPHNVIPIAVFLNTVTLIFLLIKQWNLSSDASTNEDP